MKARKIANRRKQTTARRAPAAAEPARGRLERKEYEKELARLHVELVKLQEWVKKKGLKVCIVFEGRDGAGKGGTIKAITERVSPRVFRVVALPAPTEREKSQMYVQRYISHLPAAGEVVIFDRSWYNRAGVEHVMGFCSYEEYKLFLKQAPVFEELLVDSGVILLKYWFSVNDEEQERRFQERVENPIKRWKLSPMDLESRKHWVEYSHAKDVMLERTDTKACPWFVVDADDKKKARLNCIAHLLGTIPYKDLSPEPLELPERQVDATYKRPPKSSQRFVPRIYR